MGSFEEVQKNILSLDTEELNKALSKFNERRDKLNEELKQIDKEEKTLLDKKFGVEIGDLEGKYLYIEELGAYHIYMKAANVEIALEDNGYWSILIEGPGVIRLSTMKDSSLEFKSSITRKFFFDDDKSISKIKKKLKILNKEDFIEVYQKFLDSCQKTLNHLKE